MLIKKNLVNIPGWRTKKRIIVIESDDWGSVRMPSKEVYNILLSARIPVNQHYFAKNDCLESEEDLLALFELLSAYRDESGNHPVITANAVVANPDFEKMKNAGLDNYYYEKITETYEKYPNHKHVIELWKEYGIEKKMLWPQFHGREHLNVRYWMKTIRSGAISEKIAFDNKAILGVNVPGEPKQYYNYMAAFEYDSISHMKEIEAITRDGLELFYQLFGYYSKTFVASCAVQGEHLDHVLKEGGVDFHQCGQQFRPQGEGKYKIVNKLWGQKNKVGQIYWRRNCIFEPSRKPDYDCADHCLAEINTAFRWGKPAVINAHRVNFMGGIWPENRENSLRQLSVLLRTILLKWPDVEFMTSGQLGEVISK